MDCGKRSLSSEIENPNPAKKICLTADSNNNLLAAANKVVPCNERICGVLNLMSLFNESYANVPTKDLIAIAYEIDLFCPEECTERIEMLTRHRLLDKDTQWNKLPVGRICGSVFKDGRLLFVCLFHKSLENNILNNTTTVCHSQSKYPSKQLMSRIYRQNKDDDLTSLWFRKNFLNVRTKYERIMLNRHQNFAYRKCGLVLRSNHPQFCVTPGNRTVSLTKKKHFCI